MKPWWNMQEYVDKSWIELAHWCPMVDKGELKNCIITNVIICTLHHILV
jgi:hypothetical protein